VYPVAALQQVLLPMSFPVSLTSLLILPAQWCCCCLSVLPGCLGIFPAAQQLLPMILPALFPMLPAHCYCTWLLSVLFPQTPTDAAAAAHCWASSQLKLLAHCYCTCPTVACPLLLHMLILHPCS
jgi:hypothetical protein